MKLDLDVIVFSVSIISFENVLKSIPKELLSGKLVVDVLSVKVRHGYGYSSKTSYYDMDYIVAFEMLTVTTTVSSLS